MSEADLEHFALILASLYMSWWLGRIISWKISIIKSVVFGEKKESII